MSARTLFGLVLVVIVVGILVTLGRRNRSRQSRINLDDLLLGDDGRLSKAACVMLGAFCLTTWMMVYLTLTGGMSEGYLATYAAAWIAPTVTKLIVSAPPKPPAAASQAPTVGKADVVQIQQRDSS